MNCVMNAASGKFPWFNIFRWTSMIMQKKHGQLFSSKIFFFSKMSILGGISKTNHHLLIIDGIVHILP
jgi:hypothetical protein